MADPVRARNQQYSLDERRNECDCVSISLRDI